jgi:hypothetical protein
MACGIVLDEVILWSVDSIALSDSATSLSLLGFGLVVLKEEGREEERRSGWGQEHFFFLTKLFCAEGGGVAATGPDSLLTRAIPNGARRHRLFVHVSIGYYIQRLLWIDLQRSASR